MLHRELDQDEVTFAVRDRVTRAPPAVTVPSLDAAARSRGQQTVGRFVVAAASFGNTQVRLVFRFTPRSLQVPTL